MRFIKAITSLSLVSLALTAPSKQHRPGDGNNDGGYICCYNNNAGGRCFLTFDNRPRANRRCVYVGFLEGDAPFNPNGDGVRGNSNGGGGRGGSNGGGVDGDSNGGGGRSNSDGDDIQANSNGGDVNVNSGEGGGLLSLTDLLNRLNILNNNIINT